MKVYLLRHAESEDNAAFVVQGLDSPLNDKGKHQAKVVSEKLSKLKFDLIIASPAERTKETAQAIAEKVGLPIEFSDLFLERRRPTDMIGKSVKSSEFQHFDFLCRENFGKNGWYYQDEENYDDLNQRAKLALEYLKKQKAENVLVVTHGFFKKVLLARAILGEEINASLCWKFMYNVHIHNTGLTILADDGVHDEWRVLSWNDHSHLEL